MLPLPDPAQLQRLSAFDGDSAAAWRTQSALFAELYGAVASARVLRPAAGAPRLVALTGADGAVRIDARDPLDSAGAALESQGGVNGGEVVVVRVGDDWLLRDLTEAPPDSCPRPGDS